MDLDDDELDRTLLVIPKCYVYRIPPKRTSAGHRAADWNVKQPNWSGRLEVLAREEKCRINFVDDSGNLFASAPVSSRNPKETVEKVTDSGRYFVVRIASGDKKASIGVGFADRDEAFDFQAVIQDWETRVQEEADALANPISLQPQKDMSLKGTITVKAPIITRKNQSKTTASAHNTGPSIAFGKPTGGALLAPPPSTGNRRRRGGARPAPAPAANGNLLGFSTGPAPPAATNTNSQSAIDDILDIPPVAAPAAATTPAPADDPFAMF